MEKLRSLPFEVGQCVESKTFQKGFRGAWFRGKIKKFTHKGVCLEYYDFSDEISTLKLHQKVPKSNKAKEELMLRPHFPPVHCDGELPDASTLSEVIIVKNGLWKVGDLVDWWCDNAYWSGKITKILGDDKVEIQSPSPPFGEGLSYEASCDGLRPSLEWSLKDGWKVPVPRGVAEYSPCARLIHPSKQGEPGNKKEEKDVQNADEHPPPSSDGLQSKGKVSENQTGVPRKTVCEDGASEQEPPKRVRLNNTIPLNYTNSDSSDVLQSKGKVSENQTGVPHKTVCEDGASEQDPPKRVRLNHTIPLNSTSSNSIESVLIDFEELINRVKWIKRILNPPDPAKPQPCWEFSEHPLSKDQTRSTSR